MPQNSQKEDKNTILNESEEYLLRILNAIHYIRQGGTETDACLEYDLDVSSFRRMIFSKRDSKGYQSPYPVFSKNTVLITTEYERLLAYMMKDDGWEIHSFATGVELVTLPKGQYMPVDVHRSLKKVLREHFTERERKVLISRGIRKMSVEQIGKELNVTRERIRQIEAKALRKFRKRNLRNQVFLGIDYYKRFEEAKNEGRKIASQEMTDMLEDFKTLYYKEKKQELIQSEKSRIYQQVMETSIEDMGLSTRSKNCLRRKKLFTIGDIIHLKKSDLMEIRCLGKRSYDEIIRALRERGVELKN